MLPRSLAAAARLPAAARRRLLHRGSAGGGGAEEQVESMAYRMSMLRAPSVVRKKGILSCNSCSLIGRLDAPVRPCKGRSEEDPLAYTFLSVRHSSSSSSSRSSDFQVTLNFSGDLANVGLKYLKHDDLVYVYGFLSSYHKVSPRGERHIFYKLKYSKKISTKTGFVCGKSSLRALTSGGTTDNPNHTSSTLISSTETLVRSYGFIQMTLLG
ncbi:hypothetical protein BRADI_1g14690v3 [Brachypodium distachyon]|uniref:Uncharacterized protein n=1 Tax=Brachypodium distachyon TaxID=15368 RepID=A0A0Q3KT03_BRADI|nr:hypothetical protein BRADI_1g14690v3 [Brachypodium distachyon]